MKITSTLLLLFTGISCFAQKQTLRLNLQQDSTYYMTTNANLTITEDIPGQQQVISTIISGRMSHKVTAIKDSVYEMEVQYLSLGLQMNLPGGKSLNFNSELHRDDIISKVFSSVLNKPFLLTLSKSGKVISIKHIENLFLGMEEQFPQISEAQKAQLRGQMEQSFGEKSFKGSMQDAFAVFPAKQVSRNDQWVANTTLESLVTIKIKNTYTLKDITDKAYVIHGDAVVSPGADQGFKEISGMPMRFVNMAGTSITDIKLNKSTCWISEVKVVKLIKGTIEIKDNPKVPGGLSFPISIFGDMTEMDK